MEDAKVGKRPRSCCCSHGGKVAHLSYVAYFFFLMCHQCQIWCCWWLGNILIFFRFADGCTNMTKRPCQGHIPGQIGLVQKSWNINKVSKKFNFWPGLSCSGHAGVQKCVCPTSSWLALNRFDTYYTHVTASIISNPEMWTDYRANHRGIGKACSLQKHQESRLFSLGDKKLYLCVTNLAKAEMIRPNFGHILINHK